MTLWETIPVILLAVLIVLLPVSVIGLRASKLHPHQVTALLVLYAGVVLLVGVIASDAMGVVPSRLLIDAVLLVGGLIVGGAFARAFLPRRHEENSGRGERHVGDFHEHAKGASATTRHH